MSEKVSIITPVFNGASLIHRLLDSLLIQTYPNIDMYIVDDGSTDHTKEVIEHYVPLFEQKGYSLHYIYQENGGQSVALNNGLKYVDGDYMLWPDADDWYKTPNAIETLVIAIRQTDDKVGIVRCQLDFVDEETMDVTYSSAFSPCNSPKNLLEDAIYGTNNFLYAPIEWIIKVKYLDTFIKDREIYVNKYTGQNAQILLPYLYYSKCVTIDNNLCCYLVRKISHSHQKRDYDLQIAHLEAQLSTYVYVLRSLINIDEKLRENYIQARRNYYYQQFMALDYDNSNVPGFRKHYKECLQNQLSIGRKQCRLYFWTTLFSIDSYKMITKIVRNIVR